MDRQELARLLRRAREQVEPADVGLPAGGRRRVAGLRREEVATLAGVSVDYVVRLEQARGPHPSPSVLDSLARALRMTDAQRARLFELGDAKLPRAGEIPMLVRPSVQRLLDRLADVPAVVMSAKGDALAWNALAAALLGDFSTLTGHERNLNWQRFLGDAQRVACTPQERPESDRQAVARLLSACARYPRDTALQRLVAELHHRSPRFEALWQESPTETWVSHSKSVEHPEIGMLWLDCDTLTLPDSGQTVLVYSAEPGTAAAEQLELLRVIGTQRMAGARSEPNDG